MMRVGRLLGLTLLLLLLSASYITEDKWSDIPSYFMHQLTSKVGEIRGKSGEGASFIFVTDTHVNANAMHSPQLIRWMLDHTNIHIVIWGGDAINSHGGEIEKQWNKQLQFDTILNKVCQYYKVRGNHDFSIMKNREFPQGATFSNEKSAEYLFRNSPSNIHRNINDNSTCYYFSDDTLNKVRFIIFDSTDSVSDRVSTNGNVVGVHQAQLQWIADSAVSTTPSGYGLIFVSHIPIANNSKLQNVKQLINGVASHSSVKIGGVKYDFTKNKETRVLMCIAGHNHKDSQTYVNGVLHLTTASDGVLRNAKSRKASEESPRQPETVDEQCFDCVCVSKDKKLVRTYRIGYGTDRLFHLEPVYIYGTKKRRIKPVLKGVVRWSSSNIMDDRYKKGEQMSGDIIDIDKNGIIRGKRKGTSIVTVCDNKGNKEFFNIIVQ